VSQTIISVVHTFQEPHTHTAHLPWKYDIKLAAKLWANFNLCSAWQTDFKPRQYWGLFFRLSLESTFFLYFYFLCKYFVGIKEVFVKFSLESICIVAFWTLLFQIRSPIGVVISSLTAWLNSCRVWFGIWVLGIEYFPDCRRLRNSTDDLRHCDCHCHIYEYIASGNCCLVPPISPPSFRVICRICREMSW